MKTLIAVSVVALIAMTSGAQAGGFFTKKSSNVLSNLTGVVVGLTAGEINVLNGTTVAIGNNSNVLSGIGNGSTNNVLNGVLSNNGLLQGVLNGNSILGLGKNNKRW